MAIELVEKFLPYVDEQFSTESKKEHLTNQDFSFTGAHSVKIYKISTGKMNDYGRSGPSGENWSRYGAVESLNATTERQQLTKDRSFTFAIDSLDEDETEGQLEAATALARQMREVVIPEVDTYTLGVMCERAGNKPEAVKLAASSIYDMIFDANSALDDAEVPDLGRVLVVTPATLLLMIALMSVGTGPVSTGGGIRTTTLAVLYLSTASWLRGRHQVVVYHKRIPMQVLYKALNIFFIYSGFVFLTTFAMLVCNTGGFSFGQILFESVSAFSTVGLTADVTAQLNTSCKIILMIAMFIGRVGIMTLSIVFGDRRKRNLQFPEENISIG